MVAEQEETPKEIQELTSIPIIDGSGNPTADNFELNTSWLERNKGDQAVQDVVVAYLAARRQGSASTKNRAMIRGSGAKPWRQKGTGRARSGTKKSPLWRGGGVIFGPSPRDYSKKVNSKVRKLALRRVLTSRIDEGDVIVINNLEIQNPKTNSMLKFLKGIGTGEDVLIILENKDNSNVILGARNLPFVEIVKVESLNVYQLLLHKKMLITAKAFEIIQTRLA